MSSITPELELPILTIDKAHWQTQSIAGSEPLEYNIASGKGLIISTKGFEFTLPDEGGISAPNIIQIILGKDQMYAMAFEPGVDLYTVNASNLVPLYGSQPFSGFSTGQKLIIAVGYLSPPGRETDQPKFTILWAGVVNVE